MVSMNAGIQVADECVTEFTALRMKRSHRYMILKVSDDKTSIVIEKIGERTESFNDFKESMPKDQCR